jgi:hypothetical protein
VTMPCLTLSKRSAPWPLGFSVPCAWCPCSESIECQVVGSVCRERDNTLCMSGGASDRHDQGHSEKSTKSLSDISNTPGLAQHRRARQVRWWAGKHTASQTQRRSNAQQEQQLGKPAKPFSTATAGVGCGVTIDINSNRASWLAETNSR